MKQLSDESEEEEENELVRGRREEEDEEEVARLDDLALDRMTLGRGWMAC